MNAPEQIPTAVKGHSSLNEKQFLDEIGRFSSCNMSRRFLLGSYITAAEKRTDWGVMDSVAVLAYAAQLLQTEEQKLTFKPS